MDLWIRNQTKIVLIKTNDICIRSVLHKKDIDDKGKLVWQILANNEIVAEYCTKERALEVLDEIQNFLTPRFIVSTTSDNDCIENLFDKATVGKVFPSDRLEIKNINRDCWVYEMPKE